MLNKKNKMGIMHRSGVMKRSNDSTRLILSTILGVLFGFFMGVSLPSLSLTSIYLPLSPIISSQGVTIPNENISAISASPDVRLEDFGSHSVPKGFLRSLPHPRSYVVYTASDNIGFDCKIYVPTNPRGAELLPPGIVVPQSDLYMRRLWGEPSEDLEKTPKYLVTFTVGIKQKDNVNAAVQKFSENFTILLFHYDGQTNEWDQFEWSKRAIHVSVKRQAKWWYAKRFLHPDIVAAFDYIFIWDEDLGVEHFNADKYIELVKKHGLEISQPGIEPNSGLTWEMTKRRGDREFHKNTEEKPGWCSDPNLPPCAAFVEIMAPVFSREAWRCVWHMIQNDLVHGWGIDFALRRCAEPAHEKIGVIDSQWIIHQTIPSLGDQDALEGGKAPPEGIRNGVRARCRSEWAEFQRRLVKADKEYFSQYSG